MKSFDALKKDIQRRIERGPLSHKDGEMMYEVEDRIEENLEALAEQIMSGAYSYLIVDDSAGRIPGNIIRETLKRIYKAYGKDEPLPAIFIAGSTSLEYKDRGKKLEKVTKYLASLKNEKEIVHIPSHGRGLVVTEVITRGKSMSVLNEALNSTHLPHDICSLGYSLAYGEQTFKDREGNEVLLVRGEEVTPRIYTARHLHGVHKDPHELHARRKTDKKTLKTLAPSRALSQKIAKRLAENFLKRHPPSAGK